MRSHWAGILYLSLATVLWGTTFVFVKTSLDTLQASQITFFRFGLAVLCFLPWILRARGGVWRAGLELGLYSWVSYATQAHGLSYTTVGRSAFILTLYIVLLPLGMALLGRKLGWSVWVGAGMATLGVGLLSYDGSPPNVGDFWTLGTAVSFAVYIWRLEALAPKYPALELTTTQLVVMALLCVAWVGWEQPKWNWAEFPWWTILYLGIAATAITTWLQALGQRHVPAAESAIIFSLEPVYAAILAYFILGELLGLQGLIGAALVLSATLVSQLPTLLASRSKAPSQ